jgi:UDP-2,4-diacetamido-2,4,6-trideoxy-beta-L-altropyranose hydrolase
MRQLALAGALREAGAAVEFACRETLGVDMVEAQGFVARRLESGDADAEATQRVVRAPFDWVVVDHYELDARWERAARAFGKRILAVDDLADRPHHADLLLDQNYYAGLEQRYAGLVPDSCERLLGPDFALLRPEFAARRSELRERNGGVRRVLVSFGATDPTGQTPVALDALRRLELEIVLPRKGDDIAVLMAQTDLALGSGGVSTNERMCMGLPAAVVATHPTQEISAHDVAAIGAHRYLGPAGSLDASGYADAVAGLAAQPALLRRMSEVGMRCVDGLGTRRVVRRMLDG